MNSPFGLKIFFSQTFSLSNTTFSDNKNASCFMFNNIENIFINQATFQNNIAYQMTPGLIIIYDKYYNLGGVPNVLNSEIII